MELIADIFLVAGALGAGFYCFVLSRRLKRFNDLEKGVGGAVAVLSSQVDGLTKTLAAARVASDGANATLSGLTTRAEAVAGRLELLMASMHDIVDDETALNAGPVDEAGSEPGGSVFMRHGPNGSPS
ncbi:hypothetical protein [Pontibaca salina]|uniref:Uncharacterized protein n=1 Tax=Pontibaca salina TaxID=2795731 RepID=A0A934LZQ1_9RHOB|nr:hypothetical protein [Pontibaca salina]MBI6628918.1 hypothetical protein [Pontibaca salina]